MKILSLSAALLALSWAAGAAGADPRAPQKAGAGAKTCYAEKVTGSNLRRRICLTDEEREARRKADQEAMESFKRGAGNAGGGDPRLGG